MKRLVLMTMTIMILLSAACRSGPVKALRKDPSVLALVGRYYIDRTDFKSALAYNRAQGTKDANVMSRVFDSVVEETLVLNAATGDPVPRAPRPLGLYSEPAARERAVSAILEQKVYSRVSVPAKDIKAYYNSHQDLYRKGEGVLIRGILLSSEKDASKVGALLKKHHSFVGVARRYSLSPNKGEARYFEYSELPDYIVSIVKSAPIGIPTQPFEVSPGNYQVLLVERRYKTYTVPLKEAGPGIRLLLSDSLGAALHKSYIGELRRRFKVVIFWSRLGFDYRKENP